jgi:hypothetical protein
MTDDTHATDDAGTVPGPDPINPTRTWPPAYLVEPSGDR